MTVQQPLQPVDQSVDLLSRFFDHRPASRNQNVRLGRLHRPQARNQPPGTRGEELTVNYLVEQFKRLGLKPGNPNGTYTQKVPLAGFMAQPKAYFEAGGKRIDLKSPDEYVGVSRRYVPDVKVEIEVARILDDSTRAHTINEAIDALVLAFLETEQMKVARLAQARGVGRHRVERDCR